MQILRKLCTNIVTVEERGGGSVKRGWICFSTYYLSAHVSNQHIHPFTTFIHSAHTSIQLILPFSTFIHSAHTSIQHTYPKTSSAIALVNPLPNEN